MPRPLRAEEANAIHHVFARGNRAADIFRDKQDRHRYLRLLAKTIEREDWRCLSFCLMTNHLHLLIETPRPNLGIGMRRMHGAYGLGFNRRHSLVGHVFQGRYGAVRITDDAHLLTAVRYLDRNPVEAGVVRTSPEWPWCSSAALRGQLGPPWLAVERLRSLLPGGQIDLEDGATT